MRIDAAIVREQEVEFAVVVVRRAALDAGVRDDAVAEFSSLFEGLPTVLIAEGATRTPEYYGRQDLVDFLAGVPFEALPWAEYSVSS